MSTTAQNNLVRQVGGKKTLSYPIKTDGTADINAGDLVYWDSSAKVVKSLDSDAHAATLVGVAAKSSYVNPFGTKQYEADMSILVGNIHAFNTNAGDTFNHGDGVFFTTDAQTVTSTDPGGGHKVGYVMLRPGQSAVTGASGTTIDILVVGQSPVSNL